MSTYIDLDSFHRDVLKYPNPADYSLKDSQVSGWLRDVRTITYNRVDNKIPDFVQSIKVMGCILPYMSYTYIDKTGVTVTSHTGDLQRIYIDIHTPRFNDRRLIQTIEDKIVRAHYALVPKRVQTDSNNNPVWIQFDPLDINQATRFTMGDPISITFLQERGHTIIIDDSVSPPNSAKQTWVNISVTPFSMDGNYNTYNL